MKIFIVLNFSFLVAFSGESYYFFLQKKAGSVINLSDEGQYDTYFIKIDNCKFKNMVRPGGYFNS